jgi:hypothetical protein
MIDDRRSGKTKSHFGIDADLLSILLQNELYSGDDEKNERRTNSYVYGGKRNYQDVINKHCLLSNDVP